MNEEQPLESEHLHKYVDKRLRIRMYIYIAISMIMLGFVIFHIITDGVTTIRPLVGFVIGIMIGFIFSRIFHISWDHNAEKVIYRLDTYGILVLIIYIVLELNRERLITQFVHGRSVVSISFAVLSGIMIGRVLGIRGKIARILQENI